MVPGHNLQENPASDILRGWRQYGPDRLVETIKALGGGHPFNFTSPRLRTLAFDRSGGHGGLLTHPGFRAYRAWVYNKTTMYVMCSTWQLAFPNHVKQGLGARQARVEIQGVAKSRQRLDLKGISQAFHPSKPIM